MTLAHIAVFIVVAALYGTLLPARWRGWAVFALSVIAVYWLQPPVTLRVFDFVLPGTTLALTALCWRLTRPRDARTTRDDGIALAVMVGIVLALALTRLLPAGYQQLPPEFRLTPTRPPDMTGVVPVLALVMVAGTGLALLADRLPARPVLTAMLLAIVALFVLLKTEPLTLSVASGFRVVTGQDPGVATLSDLRWLGFSYVAFRLIHTLRDRQTGRLPALSLREYVSFVVFFPALTAGPIDRAERFVKDYRALANGIDPLPSRATVGLTRIAIGLFKKFVIADSLALIALGPLTAEQATSAGGLWVLLYAFAFRLYFDFSGYSDIAIGIGILYGIVLPENFDRPYTRPNITAFWQSWHISLSNWARFYVFSPLSRSLLARKPRPSTLVVVFSAQVATMLTIGLWHGVALNFVVWGLWHGVGLFAHKVWTDKTRPWQLKLPDRPDLHRAWTVASILLTFHFVALGWVWFTVTDVGSAGQVFARLFGVGW